jgi:hypothetical protein
MMNKLYGVCSDAIRDSYGLEGYDVYAYWLSVSGDVVEVKLYDGIYPMFGEWGGYTIAKSEVEAWEIICNILNKPRDIRHMS